MNPTNKPLTEIIKEGYKEYFIFSDRLRLYAKGKERIFYDKINEQILWKYESNFNPDEYTRT